MLLMLSFYMGVFNYLANLPLDKPLYFGVHQRFWMQAHLIAFGFIGMGLEGALYIYSFIYTYIYTHARARTHTHTLCVWVCEGVCVCVCVYIYSYVYVYIICIYIYTCIYRDGGCAVCCTFKEHCRLAIPSGVAVERATGFQHWHAGPERQLARLEFRPLSHRRQVLSVLKPYLNLNLCT